MFDIIGQSSWASEKRLMHDISATKHNYKAEQISNTGLVRCSYDLAKGLTKSHIKKDLHDLITTARQNITAKQWIVLDPE